MVADFGFLWGRKLDNIMLLYLCFQFDYLPLLGSILLCVKTKNYIVSFTVLDRHDKKGWSLGTRLLCYYYATTIVLF